MKQIYFDRLRIFADFLANQNGPHQKEIRTLELIDRSSGAEKKTTLTCLYWIFSFLPDVFFEGPDDWYVDSFNGEIIYGPSEDPDKGDTITCVFSFFSLDAAQFQNLFCVNDKLSADSSHRDIAENIISWVKEN